MVYSATDAEYRANHLEEDLKAYYDVLSDYMDEKVDYKLFREEVEERRVKGMTMDGEYLENSRILKICFSHSPRLLGHPQPDEIAQPCEGDGEVLGGVQGHAGPRRHSRGSPGHQRNEETRPEQYQRVLWLQHFGHLLN